LLQCCVGSPNGQSTGCHGGGHRDGDIVIMLSCSIGSYYLPSEDRLGRIRPYNSASRYRYLAVLHGSRSPYENLPPGGSTAPSVGSVCSVGPGTRALKALFPIHKDRYCCKVTSELGSSWDSGSLFSLPFFPCCQPNPLRKPRANGHGWRVI
jgi:hypothetical protein